MDNYNLIIGSHVGMSAPKYFKGAVEQALEYQANALMIYTGAPQNTKRKPVSEMKIDEGILLLEKNNMKKANIIVHAPYIINLANADKTKRQFAIEFLKKEYLRVAQIGGKIMVLHPGNHLKETRKQAMDWIIEGLNQIIDPKIGVIIALETMAGKGTEVGMTFQELKYMIDGVKEKKYIGVCFDTCHVFDAGYDLINDLESIIKEFDEIIGLEKNVVMHINDSKNHCGSRKDRHENIGKGHIGKKTLLKIIWHPKFNNVPKILETPWIEGKPPYKEEIALIKKGE